MTHADGFAITPLEIQPDLTDRARRLPRLAYCFFYLVLSAVLTLNLWGQSTAGSVYGSVADATGAQIPSASVTLKNAQTNAILTTKSNGSGEYVFPVVEPGNYTVSATASGFQSMTETGVSLDANQNVHVTFAMQVGATDQNVTVSASTTLVDTRESQLGTTVDQQRLQELPLNGRDAYDLVALSPSISSYSEAQNSQNVGDVSGAVFSTNGLRTFQNSFYLDGAPDESLFRPGGNYAPNPDALQEIRVLTSNFDAEFGTMPGAVVNMITRSGGNKFHGGAYEFLRNNVFNANGEFTGTNHLRQNQFGANVGGPILHNKLFFFFSYQGLRIATNTIIGATQVTVPTAAERTGDFSADETSKQPKCGAKSFPCVAGATPGVIPSAYLDPMAKNLLAFLPPGITPVRDSATGLLASGANPAPQIADAPAISNQYLARGDYQLNSSHTLSGLFFREHGTQQNPTSTNATILGYSGANIVDTQFNAVGTDTWIVSPRMLNVFRIYYTRNNYQNADLFAGQHTLQELGGTIPLAGQPASQPIFNTPDFYMGNNTSAPNHYWMTSAGLGDTFNLTRGKQSIKAGVTVNQNQLQDIPAYTRAGSYQISTFASGSVLGDFLLGKAAQYVQTNGYPGTINFHQLQPAVFAQDDWVIVPRFTVNLGIRWELHQPLHGQNNLQDFVPNVQSTRIPSAPTGLLFPGDPGVPDGIVHTPHDTFAPRIGFAYDLTGDGKASLRGGVGLFYSENPGLTWINSPSSIFTNKVTLADTTNFPNPYSGSTTPDPFPFTPNLTNPTFATGLTFNVFAPYDKYVPYTMEYNLTFERQLGNDWGISMGYVGNSSKRLRVSRDENSPVYSPTCTTATCGTAASELARRPYKPATTTYAFNIITESDPIGNSKYNGLQLSLNKRFSHNFTINANYVWSKDMSEGTDQAATTSVALSNSYSIQQDYGKSQLDIPQRFIASYTWISPAVHLWGLIGKEALSGWQFNGITQLSTGTPFNVTSGVDSNFDGVSTADRPNVLSDPRFGGSRTRQQKIAGFFNTAAFAQVPAGTPTGGGNEQFDLLVGPGTVNTDFSAFKNFALPRESNLQFRAEFFNLFNNVNLSNPVSVMTSSTFGQVTTESHNARILQFGLKYAF